MDISELVRQINDVHLWFSKQVARQIDTALTLRNWTIGMYIREYEQNGADRAQYGERALTEASKRLRTIGLKGMAESTLRKYRGFYETYPQIWPTVSAKFQSADNQLFMVANVAFMKQKPS